jgi:hypothetical protein
VAAARGGAPGCRGGAGAGGGGDAALGRAQARRHGPTLAVPAVTAGLCAQSRWAGDSVLARGCAAVLRDSAPRRAGAEASGGIRVRRAHLDTVRVGAVCTVQIFGRRRPRIEETQLCVFPH